MRLLDIIEESDGDRERERRSEVRMLEKEMDWKRVVRIFADVWFLEVEGGYITSDDGLPEELCRERRCVVCREDEGRIEGAASVD